MSDRGNRKRVRQRPRARDTAKREKRKANEVITASAVTLPFVYVPFLVLVFNVHLIVAVLAHVVLVATAGLLAHFFTR